MGVARNTIQFGDDIWSEGFTMVPNHVLVSTDLCAEAKLAFALLMKFGRQDGAAYPGQVRMSRYIGCSERKLRDALKDLKAASLIEIKQRGRGQTNLYILHPDRHVVPPRPAGDAGLDRQEMPPTNNQGYQEPEEETDGRLPDRKDEAQALYDAYARKVKNEEPSPITPSLRRTAEKALKEYPLPDLVRAIDGFLRWRERKPGDMRFSSIFASYPGGRPLHDHIGFWIQQAGPTTGLSSFPSGQREKIVRALRQVQKGIDSRDPENKKDAEQAKALLREMGVEWTVENDRVGLADG